MHFYNIRGINSQKVNSQKNICQTLFAEDLYKSMAYAN